MQHAKLVCQVILIIAPIFITGCHSRRPNFMTRVREDCAAGDQLACDLLDAFSHPNPATDIPMPGNISDDVDATLRGIDRARSAPRVKYPYTPPIAAQLQTGTTISKFPPPFNQPRSGDITIAS
jgi:hypothetical protein